MISVVILRKTLIVGFHFSKFGCCKPTTFQKKLHRGFLFGVWRFFFRINIMNNSWWIAHITLCKKVKWILERRSGELQWNCKKTQQSEPLRKLYCRRFHDILSEFCLNGVSMGRCQLLWLLRSEKVIGYKVEISILDP